MAISDNDEQLAGWLIKALHDHEAGWVAAEVEEARARRTDYEEDVRMLLVAIAQTVGLVPSLVISSVSALSELPGRRTAGVILDDREIEFDAVTMDEMVELQRAVDILRAPVADLLEPGGETEAE